ncbi:hypothetical protein COH25_11435, partial [Neisseria meningitidis]
SGIRGGLRGYLGKIRRYLGRKQPKTCVWVSAVGRERNFAKVSNSTEPIHLVLQHLRESFSLS